MKKILSLLVIIIFNCQFSIVNSVKAEGWDTALYKQIESRIVAPTFKDKTYNVKKYGASPKADAAKNQKAINKAIEKCSKAGGGKVVIPAGTYQTGAIRLLSGVNLEIQKDARIVFAFQPELYPNVVTRWEGLDCINYSPCIYAYKAQNIAITGEGTIDGNGSNDTWWQWNGNPRFGFKEGITKECQNRIPYKGIAKYEKNAEGNMLSNRQALQKMMDDGVPTEQRVFGMGHGLRPQLLNLVSCENILIEGVQMVHSPFWVMHPLFSKNITIRKVTVTNEGPNGDGCDPESCEDVLIEDCIFHTGDDCIAIKSGRNADGHRTPIPSQNIIVRRCVMEDGHGGVVLGSETSAGVRNVFAEDCKMDSPNLDRVLRIKTNSCRGGVTENIYMRNIEVGECKRSVMRINLNYEPSEPSPRIYIPTVRNVYMENVTSQKSKYGIRIDGLEKDAQIYDIYVKNCSFNGVTDAPILYSGRSKDIYIENVKVNGKELLSKAPYCRYSEWMAWSEMQRVPNPIYLDFTNPEKRPQGKWNYGMGLELEAILDCYKTYGDTIFANYVGRYPGQMVKEDGSVVGYNYDEFNLDNIRPARLLLQYNRLFPETKVTNALPTFFKQLENHPRTNEGVWWHKKIYANQVWLDGIYMGLPFYTLSAQELKGKKQAKKYYDDAVDQITKTFRRTYDEKTGLWKHAWDETHSMFWADKETGLSKHTWARAMGWFVMAMTEILDALPQDYARRAEVINILHQAMAAAVKYQDKDSGLWFDVMDVKSDKNYLESTASAMFTYVLLKGSRLGYLPEPEFKEAGVKAYNAIIEKMIKVNPDMTISLTDCCAVSGLGPDNNPRRDGTFEYYMSEPIRDNDPKGVGPFIWASLEMERE
ncbi:MAG: glycoside hydrolase family 88 protein [Prevotella sp.]|nr:glycoside hydrolase family 88 protein [Prevotella sp.]